MSATLIGLPNIPLSRITPTLLSLGHTLPPRHAFDRINIHHHLGGRTRDSHSILALQTRQSRLEDNFGAFVAMPENNDRTTNAARLLMLANVQKRLDQEEKRRMRIHLSDVIPTTNRRSQQGRVLGVMYGNSSSNLTSASLPYDCNVPDGAPIPFTVEIDTEGAKGLIHVLLGLVKAPPSNHFGKPWAADNTQTAFTPPKAWKQVVIHPNRDTVSSFFPFGLSPAPIHFESLCTSSNLRRSM